MLPAFFDFVVANDSGATLSPQVTVRPWKFDKVGAVVWGGPVTYNFNGGLQMPDASSYFSDEGPFDNVTGKWLGATVELWGSGTGGGAIRLFFCPMKDVSSYPTSILDQLLVIRDPTNPKRIAITL